MAIPYPPNQWLRFIADSVNPLLLLVAIFVIWTRPALPPLTRAQFSFRVVVSLLLVILIAHFNRWTGLWKSHRAFPSGHLSFVAAVSTAICVLDRRWIPYLMLFVPAYAWLIVALHFHIWLDVAGALAFAPLLTWFILTRGGAPASSEPPPPPPEPDPSSEAGGLAD